MLEVEGHRDVGPAAKGLVQVLQDHLWLRARQVDRGGVRGQGHRPARQGYAPGRPRRRGAQQGVGAAAAVVQRDEQAGRRPARQRRAVWRAEHEGVGDLDSVEDGVRAEGRGVEFKRRCTVPGFATGDGRNQQGKDASTEQQAASSGLPGACADHGECLLIQWIREVELTPVRARVA